jgi:N-acetylmuramoyl-L-alanine amidase
MAAGLLLIGCILISGYKLANTKDRAFLPITRASAAGVDIFTNVWLVDKTQEFETYSNGLRIDNRYAVTNDPRVAYPVYQRTAIDANQHEWRSQPAGIVFHTTESDQAAFEADENKKLKRIGEEVLVFVRRHHCYHFLIDRFGQVFRIVQESDLANHSGNSVWADDQVIYVNLNASFFGIAFETQTQRGQDLPSATAAQIHSARVLTQMLRGKYRIPAANCVTHAQVSVNPSNMLVGYHTDWSGNFPFLELGLNDNYTAPPAAIVAFGFDYDPTFVHATGARIWQGLSLAEDQIRSQAAAQGLPVPQYRSILQKKYKEIIATLKASAAKEKSHAT